MISDSLCILIVCCQIQEQYIGLTMDHVKTSAKKCLFRRENEVSSALREEGKLSDSQTASLARSEYTATPRAVLTIETTISNRVTIVAIASFVSPNHIDAGIITAFTHALQIRMGPSVEQ